MAASLPARGQSHPSDPSQAAGNLYGVSVESNPQLFAVFCALDAAGFESDPATLAAFPARAALRSRLQQMKTPSAEALRQFYRDHALADSDETLARYISFALVVGPPPRFDFLLDPDSLPPDALALQGFQQVLADFYRDAQLDREWSRVEPEYGALQARYEGPVRQTITHVSGYLREIVRPMNGRTFTVFVEPMAGGRANFRNYGDHFAIVVGGREGLLLDDIRHAYIHFMLDPLILQYNSLTFAKRPLLGIAARAPRLPLTYRDDILALMDECLVRAVELRIRRLAPGQLEAALAENDSNGFILVRPLVSGLKVFEKEAPSMTLYFPDLIRKIDTQAEEARLKNVVFASGDSGPAASSESALGGTPERELSRWIDQGNQKLAQNDAAGASAIFEKILQKYPDEGRALYGLAIASVYQGQGVRARQLFERLVGLDVQGSLKGPATSDPSILSWAHVYLGRIYDLRGERERALGEYRAALAVEGAPQPARTAAQNGVESAYEPVSEKGDPAP